MRLTINGKTHTVDVPGDMPLLWVLRDVLGMTGTKFGCGIAAVRRLHGASRRPADSAPASRRCAPRRQADHHHRGLSARRPPAGRCSEAWLDLDVVQCGYCQSGQIMSAAALLAQDPNPTDADIDTAMSGNICRCGTYVRIRAAIKQAAGTARSPQRGVTLSPRRRSVSRRDFLVVPARGRWRPAARVPIGGARLPRQPHRLAAAGRAGVRTQRLRPDRPRRHRHAGLPQVEMGQGIYTAMPMLLAEELDVGLDQVQGRARARRRPALRQPAARLPGDRRLDLVRAFFEPLRQAGATARAMLVAAAAQEWGVDPASCRAEKGTVIHARAGGA